MIVSCRRPTRPSFFDANVRCTECEQVNDEISRQIYDELDKQLDAQMMSELEKCQDEQSRLMDEELDRQVRGCLCYLVYMWIRDFHEHLPRRSYCFSAALPE